MILNSSISVIRHGEQVLTNAVEPGDLVPGFGPEDPDTHRRGLGTYEDFMTEFARVRTHRVVKGPNYSI